MCLFVFWWLLHAGSHHGREMDKGKSWGHIIVTHSHIHISRSQRKARIYLEHYSYQISMIYQKRLHTSLKKNLVEGKSYPKYTTLLWYLYKNLKSSLFKNLKYIAYCWESHHITSWLVYPAKMYYINNIFLNTIPLLLHDIF